MMEGIEKRNIVSQEISHEEKIKKVLSYIEAFRKEYNISDDEITSGTKFETSCFAHPGGEIAHLLERQLAYTPVGQGAWKELEDEVLDGVLKKIEFYKKNPHNFYK